jgi:hypothetical protein
MSALVRIPDSSRTSRHVRKVQILLQKSFWGDERKFLKPLMRFTRGDVRDHSFHANPTADLPSGTEKLRSSSEVQKSTFARFLRLIDFRLLQQYRAQSRHSASGPDGQSSTPLALFPVSAVTTGDRPRTSAKCHERHRMEECSQLRLSHQVLTRDFLLL